MTETPDLIAAVQRADLEWAREAGAVAWQTLSDERARKIAGAVAAAEREHIARLLDAMAAGSGGQSRHALRNAAQQVRSGAHVLLLAKALGGDEYAGMDGPAL